MLEETIRPLPGNSAGWLIGLASDKFVVSGKIVVPFAELEWLHLAFPEVGRVVELMAVVQIAGSELPALIFSPSSFISIITEFTIIPRNSVSWAGVRIDFFVVDNEPQALEEKQ